MSSATSATLRRRRQLVNRFGYSALSNLAVSAEVECFEMDNVEGFIPFKRSGSRIVVVGDPVCDPADAPWLVLALARASGGARHLCAYQVSAPFVDGFRQIGLQDKMMGCEATFDPRKFSLQGGRMESMRRLVRANERAGVTVAEYLPGSAEFARILPELEEVSARWVAMKGGVERGLVRGSVAMRPGEGRRCFVARSSAGRIEAYVSCEPIPARNGMYVHHTRWRPDAPPHTMDHVTCRLLEALRNEGVRYCTLGLAPLCAPDGQPPSASTALAQGLNRALLWLAQDYDFRGQHRSKARYHPHSWEPRFFLYGRPFASFLALLDVRGGPSLPSLLGVAGRKAADSARGVLKQHLSLWSLLSATGRKWPAGTK